MAQFSMEIMRLTGSVLRGNQQNRIWEPRPGEACPKRRPNGIEMFYNPKQKHVRNGMLSPVEFEKQQRR